MTERIFYLVVALIFLFFEETAAQDKKTEKILKNAVTEQLKTDARSATGHFRFR